MALVVHSSGLAREKDTHKPQVVFANSGESVNKSILPISVEDGLIIVNVLINGQGPFPMIFDTAGAEAISSDVATVLGLTVQRSGTVTGSGERTFAAGYVKLSDLRVGAAQLSDVTVPVVPFPHFFTDRGDRPPVAGLIGYEFLRKFAVRLDYQNTTLVITPELDFRYTGTGLRIPLFFADKLPAIAASADGIAGRFGIDTGSTAAVVLQRTFVDENGFEVRHPRGLRLKAGGLDAIFETIATRLDRFNIGTFQIRRPGAEFPSGTTAGIPFAGIDGSIGCQILRQFVITFDYGRGALWLERSAAFGGETVEWKTGFQAIKVNSSSFLIANVLSNSPAAKADLRVGDVITEVDGRPASSLGQAEFTDLMQQTDGTIVRLGIDRAGARRSVALILKELVP